MIKIDTRSFVTTRQIYKTEKNEPFRVVHSNSEGRNFNV